MLQLFYARLVITLDILKKANESVFGLSVSGMYAGLDDI